MIYHRQHARMGYEAISRSGGYPSWEAFIAAGDTMAAEFSSLPIDAGWGRGLFLTNPNKHWRPDLRNLWMERGLTPYPPAQIYQDSWCFGPWEEINNPTYKPPGINYLDPYLYLNVAERADPPTSCPWADCYMGIDALSAKLIYQGTALYTTYTDPWSAIYEDPGGWMSYYCQYAVIGIVEFTLYFGTGWAVPTLSIIPQVTAFLMLSGFMALGSVGLNVPSGRLRASKQ